MELKQISNAVEDCKRNKHFQASSVFITQIENTHTITICLIYEYNSDKIKFAPTNMFDYDFRIFSIQDILSMILRRELEIVSIFSQSIILLDNAQIAALLYSSLMPIKTYNKYFMNKENNEFWKKERLNKSLSMLFCDIEENYIFLKNTFIPLCNIFKNSLVNCRIRIIWKSNCHSSGKAAEVTIFSNNSFTEKDIIQLQKYLFLNVSELQLSQLHMPYNNHNPFLEQLPLNIYDKTNNILCNLTEELLLKYTHSTLSENEKITYMIYYYIVATKSFFTSKIEMESANKRVLDIFLEDSISSFSKSILDHQILSNIGDKILHEFKCQSDNIRIDLLRNYIELLNGWDKVSNPDSITTSIQLLSEIRANFNEIEKDNNEYIYTYFIELCRLMFQCWDIPNYYRAYVPFCLKYITDYEI